MKKIAAIAIIAAATGSVQAEPFAPWNAPRVEARADAEQARVVVTPYYRRDVATGRDANGAPSAEVKIRPWYSEDRV